MGGGWHVRVGRADRGRSSVRTLPFGWRRAGAIVQITRIFTPMKRAYNRVVAMATPHSGLYMVLVRFFLQHAPAVGYDAEAVYTTYFQVYVAQHREQRLPASPRGWHVAPDWSPGLGRVG